ncbi:MAG: hypothetical protein NT155_00155 [Candidatus Staskawiczbacteria bacterium]|nr:hypothetical protein [Candidatus Staskawiczbacteria bacterium]
MNDKLERSIHGKMNFNHGEKPEGEREAYKDTPMYRLFEERGVAGVADRLLSSGDIDCSGDYFYDPDEVTGDMQEQMLKKLEELKAEMDEKSREMIVTSGIMDKRMKNVSKELAKIRG